MDRQKISPERKAMIVAEYDSGQRNKLELSRKYGCSYGAIRYIVEKEKTLAFIKAHKLTTEKNTIYCRKYRQKKRQQKKQQEKSN